MMLKKGTSKLVITTALLSINILIFLFRDHGFEYRHFLAASLNEKACDEACIRKWTKPNSNYPAKDLAEARGILQQYIQIDSIKSEENKLIAIGGWLRDELAKQTGLMNDSVNALPALQQYYCFKSNATYSYDCGNIQTLFSFFCTAAQLYCRNFQNIQLPTDNLAPDSHVANEIYLKDYQKWVLSDPFQNHLLVKKNNIPLSAAEYLDYNIAGGKDTVCFIEQAAGRTFADTVTYAGFKKDTYFNKNYILHFYKDRANPEVYSVRNKLKRYFWPYSWYEIYTPQQKNTNFLFRIKQGAALLLAGWSLFLLTRIFQKEKK
ncbi:MAG: hypothetical protein SGI83_19645 [Bacteroidota bacterium]|nr:hypothetical protein [Bacteroidota bacterium]